MLVSSFRIAFARLLISPLVATASAAPVPEERAKAERELAEVAAKLHGQWLGGDCVGRIAFRANGTYEWTGIGPGNATRMGKWSVRGDAPAFTLVLKCTAADDLDAVGKTIEVKFVQLDETDLVFKYPDRENPQSFERIFTAPHPHDAPAKGAR